MTSKDLYIWLKNRKAGTKSRSPDFPFTTLSITSREAAQWGESGDYIKK